MSNPKTPFAADPDALVLRASPNLENPQLAERETSAIARMGRREAMRDAQDVLAEDALSRERDAALAQTRAQLAQALAAKQELELSAAARANESQRWMAATGVGVVGAALGAAFWLRTRKARAQRQPDPFDSSTLDSALSEQQADLRDRADESALLGDSTLQRDASIEEFANMPWALGEPGDFSDAAAPTPLRAHSAATAKLDPKDAVKPLVAGLTSRKLAPTSSSIERATPPAPALASGKTIDRLAALAASKRDGAPSSTPAVSRSGRSKKPGFSATHFPSGHSENSSDAFEHGVLPDLQWVPQPMQDLLLLHRGLYEWDRLGRHGVAEQALLHHIDVHKTTSAWVYLELLHILRKTEQRKAFDQAADLFRSRFNRLAPTWLESTGLGKDLLRYELATMQLTQAWANNSVIWLLEEWLVGEPHMRRLMDIQAFREVLFLYELSFDVNDNPYKPVARPSRAAGRATLAAAAAALASTPKPEANRIATATTPAAAAAAAAAVAKFNSSPLGAAFADEAALDDQRGGAALDDADANALDSDAKLLASLFDSTFQFDLVSDSEALMAESALLGDASTLSVNPPPDAQLGAKFVDSSAALAAMSASDNAARNSLAALPKRPVPASEERMP